MIFRNRVDAGKQLAQLIAARSYVNPIVIALPRGGLPVAQPVAEALNCELDVLVVRKLGVPGQEEVGFGAIAEKDTRVLNSDLVEHLGLTTNQIENIVQAQQIVLEQRLASIRKNYSEKSLLDKTVIIIDDGIATGIDAKAACALARKRGAKRIVLAVPVAPSDWKSELENNADEYIAVIESDDFGGVGQFYEDFSQVTDDQVLAILADLNREFPSEKS